MLGKRIKSLVQSILRRTGYEVTYIKVASKSGSNENCKPYFERKEYGPSNLQEKLSRRSQGLPFEWPEIVNLNNVVESLLGNTSRIVELGCGTGKFAFNASQNRSRSVVASEFDSLTYKWCLENIPKQDNLVFINGPVPAEYGCFDVSVSIDVVEHISNYVDFLMKMRALAPRSLITTPNRKRSSEDYHNGPPNYFQHVREWTAGEFYWVLRCFWNDVRLYALTSQTEPYYIRVSVDTTLSPLIADCRLPIL